MGKGVRRRYADCWICGWDVSSGRGAVVNSPSLMTLTRRGRSLALRCAFKLYSTKGAITPLSTHIIVDSNTHGESHMERCRLSICLAKRSFSCRLRGRSFPSRCMS